MSDIETLLRGCDVSGYLRPIETKQDWIAYRDPRYPINSASLKEQRFNSSGQAAFYIASGRETARLNVPEWRSKIECAVVPQTLYCFDLAAFSKDKGIYDDFLKNKLDDGYPLPQKTADLLLDSYGVSGILYTSYPDYLSGMSGCCIVVRQQSGKLCDGSFFISGPVSKGK